MRQIIIFASGPPQMLNRTMLLDVQDGLPQFVDYTLPVVRPLFPGCPMLVQRGEVVARYAVGIADDGKARTVYGCQAYYFDKWQSKRDE